MLPRVKIIFQNGALRMVSASPDGVLGLLCTGVAVASTFALSKPYTLRSFSKLADLGVTEANNPHIVKIVKEYYGEAGEGSELWLMAFPDTVKLSDMVDQTKDTGKLLINAANGRLRGLVISRKPAAGYTPTITNGLDADVELAKTNAQALGVWAAETKFAPVFTVIEGYAYGGDPISLKDLHTETKNRVMVMIGDTVADSSNAAVGVLAGRIAASSIERNIGRVKSLPLQPLQTFIGEDLTETADVESIHNKGYITFRTFVRRSGYFFNDDFMATNEGQDDYSHLTARRTIDEAYRFAYDTLSEELLETIPINTDGTMQHAIIKSLQQKVVRDIGNNMKGKLSSDPTKPDDTGVTCYIDAAQDVRSTSRIIVSVKVKPFGYARYFDVLLGFDVAVV